MFHVSINCWSGGCKERNQAKATKKNSDWPVNKTCNAYRRDLWTTLDSCSAADWDLICADFFPSWDAECNISNYRKNKTTQDLIHNARNYWYYSTYYTYKQASLKYPHYIQLDKWSGCTVNHFMAYTANSHLSINAICHLCK